jgi:hypothetical protein
MPDRGIGRDPASEDAQYERDVLTAVLEVHPAQITEVELVREFADDPEDFLSRDGFARATRELTRVGLLHRSGEFVLPTRAAVRIKEIWGLIG